MTMKPPTATDAFGVGTWHGTGTDVAASARRWLETAALWRFGSLLFQVPSPATQDDLAKLVSEVPGAWQPAARKLTRLPLDEREAEYHRVLGPAGCPACESSCDDNTLAGRGPVIADVAGFYEAFAFRPDPAAGEVPDHVAVELGFLAFLAMKIAFALYEGRQPESVVAREAYATFLRDHLGYWESRFRERLMASGSAYFVEAAKWLERCR